MENNEFYQIPINLEKIWIFKYIVQISYSDLNDNHKTIDKEVYGFCIGPTFQAATAYLESYFGDELIKICHLEPINAVTLTARSYENWNEIAESLSWGSNKLEPYIG